MLNVTFTLEAYKRIHNQRLIFAAILTLLYPVIIFANLLIIYVISMERSLHKPMYILICNLACINLYGGSSLAPFVVANIITGTFQISWIGCLVQIFSFNTYGGCEIMNLMMMAYDRYISICFPLTYEKLMSPLNVMICIILIWLIPFSRAAITLSITASLQICGNVIEKIYCDNYSVVKLACSDTTSNNIYSTIVTFYSVLLPFFIIIYSYIRIIFICLQLTRKGRTKLMNTCMPHIVSITSFFIGCAFELFQSRFDLTHVPYTVRVILSLYFLILSPILNPVIYGAKTEKINETIKTKISNVDRTNVTVEPVSTSATHVTPSTVTGMWQKSPIEVRPTTATALGPAAPEGVCGGLWFVVRVAPSMRTRGRFPGAWVLLGMSARAVSLSDALSNASCRDCGCDSCTSTRSSGGERACMNRSRASSLCTAGGMLLYALRFIAEEPRSCKVPEPSLESPHQCAVAPPVTHV
ncbi:olfactory receptor 1496-like [Alosa pseudoharengus]|uniref:olfactory receptor 1496-like n=1 Tax=Alosa pseudoharengus TaxID=34774 RepID=UPI003F8C24E1